MSQLPSFVIHKGSGSLVSVFVQPRAAKDAIAGIHGSAIKLKLRAPPVDDKANRSLRSVLAELLNLAASDVTLVSGASSRHKKVFIPLSPARVAEALAPYLEPR